MSTEISNGFLGTNFDSSFILDVEKAYATLMDGEKTSVAVRSSADS